jgi:hypothetical protein
VSSRQVQCLCGKVEAVAEGPPLEKMRFLCHCRFQLFPLSCCALALYDLCHALGLRFNNVCDFATAKQASIAICRMLRVRQLHAVCASSTTRAPLRTSSAGPGARCVCNLSTCTTRTQLLPAHTHGRPAVELAALLLFSDDAGQGCEGRRAHGYIRGYPQVGIIFT